VTQTRDIRVVFRRLFFLSQPHTTTMPIPRRVLADRTNANTQSKNTKKRRAEHDPLQRPLKFFKQDTPTHSQPDEPAIKTIALPIQPPPKTPDLTSFAPSRLLNQMARGHLRQHTSMKCGFGHSMPEPSSPHCSYHAASTHRFCLLQHFGCL
jgi:hypothetical protein